MDPDSNSIILQLVILLILIGVNAFFAMSEIAIVTFNDNKLKKLAEDGNKRAATLYKMVQQPSKFLSTIQIGVTMGGLSGRRFRCGAVRGACRSADVPRYPLLGGRADRTVCHHPDPRLLQPGSR